MLFLYLFVLYFLSLWLFFYLWGMIINKLINKWIYLYCYLYLWQNFNCHFFTETLEFNTHTKQISIYNFTNIISVSMYAFASEFVCELYSCKYVCISEYDSTGLPACTESSCAHALNQGSKTIIEGNANYRRFPGETTKREGTGRWPWNTGEAQDNWQCWQVWSRPT